MLSADVARDRREWHVSVNVCTYNRQRLLRHALESLLVHRKVAESKLHAGRPL